ncbi:MAG: hypothetical protein ACAI25_05950 [Planctomycetota bacterium]
MRLSIAALVLLLGLPLARAEEPAPPPPSATEEAEKPYTEGWRGGSPPGEHVAFRAELWALSKQRSAIEIGRGLRFHPLTTTDLGHPSRGAAGGLGVELYTGKTGWLSLDWWTQQARGGTTLAREISLADVTFAPGSQIDSEITQHTLRVRDGLDIRYRIPIAAETWLDFNFGPVSALLVRYESIEIRTLGAAGPRSRASLLGVTLSPGLRAGVDLHVVDGFTVRVGSDVDFLPNLRHNFLSFTRAPSVDTSADARAYLAVRFQFVELAVGWRYFKSLASGGRFRHAESEMRGLFAELAARF